MIINFLKRHICLIIIILLFSDSLSILEIPLSRVQVEGVSKYGNIKLKRMKIPGKNESNQVILMDEGDVQINTDYLMVGTIKIGSNSQKFNLIFDTGSDLLWIPKLGSRDDCTIKNHFNPSISTTSSNTGLHYQITYGTGSCEGYIYSDIINSINNKNFKMLFGVSDKTSLCIQGVDGIIGLTKSYDNEQLSIIHMLKKGGITDSLAFSFKFNSGDIRSFGKFYIGEHEDFSSSDSVDAPLSEGEKKMFWTCKISSFGIKDSSNQIESEKEFDIIFDTGTNFLLLPYDYFEDLKDDLLKMGCIYEKDTMGIQVVCAKSSKGTFPNLQFKINGNTFYIPGDFVFYQVQQYLSTKLLFTKDNFIIGTPFFFAFHTLFDEENKELKFYPMKKEYLEKGGLSTTIIVIIVIISVIVLAIIIVIIYFYCKAKRRKIEQPSDSYYTAK
jgi:hypothetical protein